MSETRGRIRDFRILDDVDALRSMARRERLAMLGLLAEQPMSGTAIARRLGMDANRAHYHLNRLLAAGLIDEVPPAGARRRTEERLFTAVAHHFVVHPGLACRDPEAARSMLEATEHAFDEWRRREILAVDIGAVARSVVSDSLAVRPGEAVMVMFGPYAFELAEAIMVELERAGGVARPRIWSRSLVYRMLEGMSEESLASLRFPPAEADAGLAAFVHVTAYLAQGPPPPPELRPKLAHLMEAVSRWQRSLRERRVRSLEVALPTRAEFEGGWTTAEDGLAAYWRCLTASPATLHDRALSLLDRVRRSSSRTLTLSSARGGSFEVEIDPDHPHVSDGVIDAGDVARGATAEVLPAGSIAFLPCEESGDGVLHCEYAFAMGRHFRDLTMVVRRGRIISIEGGDGVDDLRSRIRASPGEPDRVAEIRFGLNPGGAGLTGKFILDACLAGNVTVTFGNNELLGGRVRSTLDLWLPSRSTTVRAGETVLLDPATARPDSR